MFFVKKECLSMLIVGVVYLSTRTLASDIECVPIHQCPFAYRVANRTGTKNAPFFIDSVCGYDEKRDVKIWCNKLVECTTPENQKGTCVSLKSCAHYVNLLHISNITNTTTKTILRKFRCNDDAQDEVYICCPNLNDHETFTDDHVKRKISDISNKIDQSSRYNSDTNLKFSSLETTTSKNIKRAKRHFSDYNSWNSQPGQNEFNNNENAQLFKNRHDFRGPPPYWRFGKFSHRNNHFYDFKDDHYSNENHPRSSKEKNYNFPESHTNNHFDNWNHNKKDFFNSNMFEKSTVTCTTPDDQSGICIPAMYCKTLLQEQQEKFKCLTQHTGLHVCCPKYKTIVSDTKKDKINSTIIFEEPNDATFKNEPNKKVQNSKDTSKSNSSSFNSEFKNNTSKNKSNNILRSLENICGTQELNDNKIIGGTATDLGEFPWLALLQYSGVNGLTFGCAGSLITDRFVLTAAHCLDQNILRQQSLANLFRVVLGEYDIRNTTDCIYMKYGTSCADPTKYFSVEKTILHNLYQSRNPSPNDIGLIKLDEKVTFTDFIRPICLPIPANNLRNDEKVIISGWGQTEKEKMSSVKTKASLRIASDSECNQNLQGNNISRGQFCLASGNGVDSCNGDSGGSVMWETRNKFGSTVFTLIGVISYGFRPCGQFPSVATNVSEYTSWIEDNLE